MNKIEITLIALSKSGILSSLMLAIGSHGLVYRKMKSEKFEGDSIKIKILTGGELNTGEENLISSIEHIAGVDHVVGIAYLSSDDVLTRLGGEEEKILHSNDSITPEVVQLVEKRLVRVLGLIATPLVRQAVATSGNVGQLFLLLGEELDSREEYAEFMSITDIDHALYKRKENKETITSIQKEVQIQEDFEGGIHLLAHDNLTPEVLEIAKYKLSETLGLAAPFLVKAAASKTKHIGDFFLLLADELDEDERDSFLSVVEGINLGAL